jgi:hypothetical protein
VSWFSPSCKSRHRCQWCGTPTLKEWLQCRRDLVQSVSRTQVHQHMLANLGPALNFSSFTIFIPEHSLSTHSVSSFSNIAALQHIAKATFRTLSSPSNRPLLTSYSFQGYVRGIVTFPSGARCGSTVSLIFPFWSQRPFFTIVLIMADLYLPIQSRPVLPTRQGPPK